MMLGTTEMFMENGACSSTSTVLALLVAGLLCIDEQETWAELVNRSTPHKSTTTLSPSAAPRTVISP